MRRPSLITTIAALILLGGAVLSAQLPVQRDVLAGHVTGPHGPVAGATITVLSVGAPAGTFPVTARTDAEGRWLAAVQDGTGTYTIRVIAIGMTPVSASATRGASRRTIIVDLGMQESPVVLEAMRVVAARRPRPPRQDQAPDRAASDRVTDSFAGAIAVADQGDLASMAATVPGVSLVPDPNGGVPGFSVLGLSSDQNRVTLNGMSFGGGDLPRDAFVVTRVASTSYDVSRGGFSGGQLSIVVPSGNNFSQRLAHVTIDNPALQTTDLAGRRLGARYANTQVSGAASGPIVFGKLLYNVALQAGRRSSDLQSLLTSDPSVFPHVGVSLDSVKRFTDVLHGKGMPLSVTSVPSARMTENASILSRLDWTPSADRIGNLVVSVRRNSNEGALIAPTAAPGHGGTLTTTGADLTANFSSYVRNSYLNDLRVGARATTISGTPYLDLPEIRTLVSSQLADGAPGVTQLVAGGNSALPRVSRSRGVELYDMLSWMSVDRRHRIRITADLRADGFSLEQLPGARGSYLFGSIADLEANRPIAYSRRVGDGRSSATALAGSLAVGDEWRPGERSQITYGLRADVNRVLDRPTYNPLVDAAFGVRNDHAPRVIDLSPRVSFFRAFGSNGSTGIPGFGAPWGNIRGGTGLFRNDIAPTVMSAAMIGTGMPGSSRQVTCVGPAVSEVDWTVMDDESSSALLQCADALTSPFVSARPSISLIDASFAAQRSWRSSLALNGFLIPGRVRFTTEGIYSLNLHQQSPLDLNFQPAERFRIAGEGNRPVYAAATSIVPASGAVTSVDSRRDAAFGAVSSLLSDRHSTSKQLIVTVFPAPGDALGRFTQWQAAYALQRIDEETRGFSGTTAGNPLEVETSRGSFDSRHQVTVSFATRVGQLFSVNTTARVSSGTPFTPLVNSDLNADGIVNDRAFVFAPSSADSVARAGMHALLGSASSRVRSCISRQFGRVAGRNSCEGPWTATMNAVLVLNPERLGMNNRTQISLSLTNVPAGIDALLHGTSRLQGWGQPAMIDPTLLLVRGFDPATNRYRYEVNPNFGDTRMTRNAIRSPFLLTIEARVQLGRDFIRQNIEQALAPGRTKAGARITAGELKQRLAGAVFNPVRGLLQAKDSLSVLTNEQLARLTDLDRRVSAREDSIVVPVADFFATQPDNYSESAVLARTLEMMNRLFDVVIESMQEARTIFSAGQIAEFPPLLRSSFDIERLKTARPTAGFDPQW